ncbi:hypothetical protein D5S17_21800 [Pseudonocardiaceae bacterium YIM PH 21723]|nr:hypothetical protein D5S17_21800 [Pseudonocardiaceae bacterium YIM PH 21723]
MNRRAPLLIGLLVGALLGVIGLNTKVGANAFQVWGPAVSAHQDLSTAVGAAAPQATIGAMVFDRQTGQTLVEVNAERQFRTQSLVKLLMALDALDNHAAGSSPKQLARLRVMLSASDDDVANGVWSQDGRTRIVTGMAGRIGLPGTQGPDDPNFWGDTLTTPADLVRIYRYLLDRESPASRDTVLDALRTAPRVAADGFDQHFGIPTALDGHQWAVKQGWADRERGKDLHTTGLVDDRYIVVVLTEQGNRVSMDAASAVVTAVVKSLSPALT